MISENLINQSCTIFYVLDIIFWFTQNEKNNTIYYIHIILVITFPIIRCTVDLLEI